MRVPGDMMAPLQEALRDFGYQLRGAADNCLVEVKGEGRWILDLRAQPIELHSVDTEQSEEQVKIQLDAATLMKFLRPRLY